MSVAGCPGPEWARQPGCLAPLGARQPGWSEVLGAAALHASSTWKLHAKRVPTIDLAKVAQLSGGVASLEVFQQERGWLEDGGRYEKVPIKNARGTPSARLSDEWIEQMLDVAMIKEVQRGEVSGHVRMFVVPEPAKQRFRPIKHTVDVNDILGKETLRPLRFPTKLDICDLVHRGECFIALDFSAYYDQIKYAEEIGRRFCFRQGSRYFRLNTLAMGQRQAVGVADSVTARLVDFGPESVVRTIIDNVIFVGSREQVVRDATIFVERVRFVGAMLNEDVSDIAALVQTVGDWGGVHLDFTAKTSSVTAKTLDKLDYSWSHRGEWTWRRFAGHVGLLFWTWQLLDLPMAEFFPLLRFVSAASKFLTEDNEAWEQPARVWDSAWPALERWTMIALRNKPRVVPRVQAPEWLVATDASEWGWGYFAVHNTSGAVRTFGAQWSAGFRQKYGDMLWRSTFTEPQGVVNALCHLIDPSKPSFVRVMTDNTPTQASFARGYNARCFHINECLRRLYSIFGTEFTFDFVYLPGAWNPADAFSRGMRIAGSEEQGDQEVGARLRGVAGSAVCPRHLV